jgi:hypothetical protein
MFTSANIDRQNIRQRQEGNIMKLVNDRTGEFRKVTATGAFFGALFLGPFYILLKGVWTWGLLMLALNILLAFVAPPLLFIAWFLWAGFTPVMIQSFYEQRGFVGEGATA